MLLSLLGFLALTSKGFAAPAPQVPAVAQPEVPPELKAVKTSWSGPFDNAASLYNQAERESELANLLRQAGHNDVNALDFPPDSWLGWGMDMRQTSGIDNVDWRMIDSVTERGVRIIKNIGKKTEQKIIGTGSKQWLVPIDDVDVSNDEEASSVWQDKANNGIDMAAQLETEADAKLSIFKASGKIDWKLTGSYRSNHAYLIWAWVGDLLHAELKDFDSNPARINTDYLAPHINFLPEDITDKESYQRWNLFFKRAGTHVIIGAYYGARSELTVHIENSKEAVNTALDAYAGATFGSLPIEVHGKVEADGSLEWFQSRENKSFETRGGDYMQAAKIANDPFSKESRAAFDQWQQTVGESPDIMGLKLLALWDLLGDFPDKTIRGWASKIKKSWTYLETLDATHVTKGKLTVDSDWGAIKLTSEGELEITKPGTTGTTTLSEDKSTIAWHRGPKPPPTDIEFVIKNKGAPASMACDRGDIGTLNFQIEEQTFTNDLPPGPKWKEWRNIAVNPIPEEPFSVSVKGEAFQ